MNIKFDWSDYGLIIRQDENGLILGAGILLVVFVAWLLVDFIRAK